MSELTDLEICKRIAEIEGLNVRCLDADIVWIGDGDYNEYNPLTDKALCFDLMVKHEIDSTSPYRPNGETRWEANYWIDGYGDAGGVFDENPQRAICLAIIEQELNK